MGGPEMAPHTPQRSGAPGEAGGPLYNRGIGNGFVPVAKTSEVAPGAMKWVVIDRERVVVANVDGVFYALRDSCVTRGRRCRRERSWAMSSSAHCTSRASTRARASC